jgi:transcription elongation factor Elf1
MSLASRIERAEDTHMSFHCPNCDSPTVVRETRGEVRMRRCKGCNKVFRTEETELEEPRAPNKPGKPKKKVTRR